MAEAHVGLIERLLWNCKPVRRARNRDALLRHQYDPVRHMIQTSLECEEQAHLKTMSALSAKCVQVEDLKKRNRLLLESIRQDRENQ